MLKATATLTSVFVLAFAVVAAAGCEPAVPANPSYETDVKPIFYARCVRCHDETFRGETTPEFGATGLPLRCHLNRYDSMGDCSATGQMMIGVCSFGAGLCANSPELGLSLMHPQLVPPTGPPLMPPPPAQELNDYEFAVVNKWMTTLDANGLPAR